MSDEAYEGIVVGRQNNFLPIGSSVAGLPLPATDCGSTLHIDVLCVYEVLLSLFNVYLYLGSNYIKIGLSFARELTLPILGF